MPIRFSPESQTVLLRAQGEAQGSGLLWPLPEHLLLALVVDPSVALALDALGLDVRRLAQQTRDYLAAPERADRGAAAGEWPQRVWRWLFPPVPREVALIQRRAAVQVLVSGRADITPLDLLVALFRVAEHRRAAPAAVDVADDPYRRANAAVVHPLTTLRQAGVTTVALLRYLAHGDTPHLPAPVAEVDPAALMEVHLLNDDYTTMEFVVAVLRDEFGMGPQQAADLAARVHWEGIGVVGVLPYGEAEPARQRIEARSARVGFPLKVVVVPAGEG